MEVRGLSASDVEELLAVVEMIREMQADNNLSQAELAGLLTQSVELVQGVQAEHSAAIRDNLRQVLMSGGVSLNPPASLVQAQRLAAHRDALLSTPVFTHDTLSELRGDNTVSSTRTWLARRREDRSLFTVGHNGRTLIPAFQLDDHGEPRPELTPLLSALHDGGVEGWALWTWLTKPTSYLSGGVPEHVARAQRFAAAQSA